MWTRLEYLLWLIGMFGLIFVKIYNPSLITWHTVSIIGTVLLAAISFINDN